MSTGPQQLIEWETAQAAALAAQIVTVTSTGSLVHSYAPGSFTALTENWVTFGTHVKLTGQQRIVLQGTGRMRIT